MEVSNRFFCGCSLTLTRTGALTSTGPDGFMVLCLRAPEGSTGSGSDLKCLRRVGHGLKSRQTNWENRLFSYGKSIKFSLFTQIIIIYVSKDLSIWYKE